MLTSCSIISIVNFDPVFLLLGQLQMLIFHSKITSKVLIKVKNRWNDTSCDFSRNLQSSILVSQKRIVVAQPNICDKDFCAKTLTAKTC